MVNMMMPAIESMNIKDWKIMLKRETVKKRGRVKTRSVILIV